MRLRTDSDAVARMLAVAGLLLVLAAGAVEALRFTSPAVTSAASAPERAQSGGDGTATPSPEGEATAAPTATAATTAPTEAAPSAPTEAATAVPAEAATSVPAEAATTAPTEAAPSAPTETATAVPAEAATSAPTEAATAAPAEAATATVPPEPTESSASAPPQPPIGDEPLHLSKSASLPSVVPGQTFSYRLELTSASTGAVEVRDFLDAQLEVMSASMAGGSCSVANPVVCSATVAQGQPAAIDVTVRVRPETAVGATLVSQALVQDARSFTVSSEPVVVQVAALGAAVQQGGLRHAELQQAGTPTPIITEEEAEPEPIPAETPAGTAATPVVTATLTPEDALLPPGATPTPIISGEEEPEPTEAPDVIEAPTVAGPIEVTPSAGVAATAAYPAPQAPTSAATPVIRPPTRPAQAVVPLPGTSATAPTAGVGVGLIGLALILHGARRVRLEHGLLRARIGAFARLRSLARAVLRLQRATAETTAEMDDRAQSLADRLR